MLGVSKNFQCCDPSNPTSLLILLCGVELYVLIIFPFVFGPGEPFFFVPNKVNVIPLHVLEEATDNFSEHQCIGEGGYGKVYKVQGVDGALWAVKRSKLISDNGLLNFVLEVNPDPNNYILCIIISKYSHGKLT